MLESELVPVSVSGEALRQSPVNQKVVNQHSGSGSRVTTQVLSLPLLLSMLLLTRLEACQGRTVTYGPVDVQALRRPPRC